MATNAQQSSQQNIEINTGEEVVIDIGDGPSSFSSLGTGIVAGDWFQMYLQNDGTHAVEIMPAELPIGVIKIAAGAGDVVPFNWSAEKGVRFVSTATLDIKIAFARLLS